MAYTILQIRRDTAANWSSNNPVLLDGEFGLNTDTGGIKLGDGSTAWNSLAYRLTQGVNTDSEPQFATVDLVSTSPDVTMRNSTAEDISSGRESALKFRGTNSTFFTHTLAKIESSHDGAANDQKGKIIISTNDGSDGDSPTVALTIDSNQDATFVGNVTAANLNISNWNDAYTHSQDNTQAHSDYLLNTGDTASGDYTFDTSTFHIDSSNNRVGIGTTSPNAMIEVYNSASLATFRVNNGVSTAGYGGSQLQFFGSASAGGADDKNFAINNINAWTAGGENSLIIQARKDDGTFKADLLQLTQDTGKVFLPKVYAHDVGAVRDLLIKSDGQLGYNSSSIKYKENVKDYVDSSDIYKLRPVEYDRKDGSVFKEKGLIAEEVESADVNIPNLVSYKRGEKIIDTGGKDEFGQPITRIEYYDTDEPETVNYSRLIVPMLAALQEQNKKIAELEARIAALEKKGLLSKLIIL